MVRLFTSAGIVAAIALFYSRIVAANATTISLTCLLAVLWIAAAWGPDYGDANDYLRDFINHLRKKIEPNPAKPKYILTEPWVGYRFVVSENS